MSTGNVDNANPGMGQGMGEPQNTSMPTYYNYQNPDKPPKGGWQEPLRKKKGVTQTRTSPFFGTPEMAGEGYNMLHGMLIDPVTGMPRQYQGPQQQHTSFDPLEAFGYNQTASLIGQPNPYSQMGMGQAQRLFNQENPAASNVVLNTLDSQYLSQENPGMQAVLDRMGKSATDAFNQATGQTSGMFSNQGTFGGSRHRDAQNANAEILAQTLAQEQGGLIFDNYNQRMAEQQAMATQVGQRGDAYNLGGMDELRFANARRGTQQGSYRRAGVTDPNRDIDFANAGRAYDHYMGVPNQMGNYMANVNRGTGGANTVTSQVPRPSTAQQVGQAANVGGQFLNIFGKPA